MSVSGLFNRSQTTTLPPEARAQFQTIYNSCDFTRTEFLGWFRDFKGGDLYAKPQSLQDPSPYKVSGLKKVVLTSSYALLSQSHQLLDVISPFFNKGDLKYLDNLLLECAANGDVNFAEYLIGKGAAVQAKTPEAKNPLHVAAYHGHTEVVRLLLRQPGINVKWASECSFVDDKRVHAYNALTALACAENGKCEIAELLIDHGIDIDDGKDRHDKKPLEFSIIRKNLPLAELLINRGAQVDYSESNRSFQLAAAGGFQAILELMLSKNPSINHTELKSSVTTPVERAAANNHFDTVMFLVNRGAEVRHQLILWLSKQGAILELK